MASLGMYVVMVGLSEVRLCHPDFNSFDKRSYNQGSLFSTSQLARMIRELEALHSMREPICSKMLLDGEWLSICHEQSILSRKGPTIKVASFPRHNSPGGSGNLQFFIVCREPTCRRRSSMVNGFPSVMNKVFFREKDQQSR